ncbi:MAG: SIMPL domain-containing protein [Candidatus Eremiobacterota bacterium]
MKHWMAPGLIALGLVWGGILTRPAPSEPAPRVVKSEGVAEIEVPPDRVVYLWTASGQEEDLDRAAEKVERQIRSLTTCARRYQPDAGEIRTEAMSVDHRTDGCGRRLPGYVASQSVSVSLTDLGQRDAFLRDGLKLGMRLRSVDFDCREVRRHRDRARLMALRAAREKADAMARETGLRLGKPVEVAEEPASIYSYLSPVSNHRTSVEVGSGSGLLQPGRISISSQVTVTFQAF